MNLPKGKAWNCFLDYFLVLVGTSLMGLCMDVFTVPNHIVAGGVNGISMIINFLTGFPVGTGALIINIPLLILGFIFLGKKFIFKTLVSSISFTFFTDFIFKDVPTYTHNALLATICAGVLMGVGLGLIYMRGGSSAGTDITSRLLQKKYPYLKMGGLNLVTNAIIIGFAVLCFHNLEAALYAIIMIYIQSNIIDKFLYGLDVGKMIMIVTTKQEAISEAIMVGMKHGCTLLSAKGAYTGEDCSVVLCAIHKNEFYRLKKLVYSIDEQAFVIVSEAGEVVGKGFSSKSLIPKELQ